jgi:putative ABC transport system permease protein
MDKHINYIFKGTSWSEHLSFQPLLKIYLHSRLQGEIGPVGNLPYLILFSFIAMVIFIIACINFINLTSARLTTRLRETGVRKVHGATRGNILLQFLTESVVLNLVSLLLAFIIAESVLPVLNAQLGLHLVTYQPATFYLTLGVISAILTLGILAGSYPALYLTSYNEVESIKNIIRVGSVGVNLRKVTVLLQYCVSVAMIICTLFLFKQLHYINHRDPGFDRKNIVALPLSTSQVSRKHELLKSSFSDIPSVEYVAVSSDYPGRGLARNGYTPEGYQDALITSVIDGDEDLLPVLGLKVVQGRNFSASYPSDGSRYLVNEAYVRSLNWENPLGRYIERNGKHEVIGIVGDFNFAPLHERIAPLIITMIPEEGFNYMLIRVMPGQMDKVLADIRKKWESLVPELPFEYFYLEDALRTVYSKEQHLSELVLLFTILAIFIAFLGLFGLSSYETVRQTKNIGIRKVNGAGSGSILLMLCTGFLKWVLVAFIFACPLAYYTMQWWLRQFAYKTTLSLWVFVAAGLFALVVALITVSWQSFSAASKNPVDALRYE